MKTKILPLTVFAFAFTPLNYVFSAQAPEIQPVTQNSFLDNVPSAWDVLKAVPKVANFVVVGSIVAGGGYICYKVATNKKVRDNIALIYDIMNGDKLQEILDAVKNNQDGLSLVQIKQNEHDTQFKEIKKNTNQILTSINDIQNNLEIIDGKFTERFQELFLMGDQNHKKTNTKLDKLLNHFNLVTDFDAQD